MPSPVCKEGVRALGHDIGWASAVGGLYQTVNAPGGTYMVGGWVHAGCDGGQELVELRAIDGEFPGDIPAGTAIASFSSSTDWTWCAKAVDITTGKLTVATRASQWWAVNMLAGHFDGIVVAPCARSSIPGIKTRSQGDAVATDADKVVSAVFDPNTFYMQEQSRCSGIRVDTLSPHGLTEGDRVSVVGTLRVSSGEAVIEDAAAVRVSAGPPPAPLAMSNRTVGGGSCGLQ